MQFKSGVEFAFLAKDQAIFAEFKNTQDLGCAVDALAEKNIFHSQIATYISHQGSLLDDKKESKIAEGIIIGAILGIFLGAALFLFFNIHVLSVYEPEFINSVRSKVTTILVGAAVGGMICGFLGAMVGLVIPEHRLKDYITSIAEGHILLKVKVAASKAISIRNSIQKNGGKIIQRRYYF